MEDAPAAIPSGLVINPETVSNQTFTSAFRGYHPVEVKQFLSRVADEMAAAAGREVELRRALQEALDRAAHPQLDEATVTTVLGEHAARLLASARETASSIVGEAREQADVVRRDAEARAARMRDEAEGLLARRMAEADAASGNLQQAAAAEVHAVVEQAQAEAAQVVEAAKEQGKAMVAEARDLRERMLGDLSRRRRTALLQVEQLRAARDRLLAAYDVVRRTADEATAELTAAEPEARLAAEAVRQAVEVDVATARMPRSAPAPSARVPAPDLVAAPAGRSAPGGEAASAPPSSRFRRLPDKPVAPPPNRPPLRPQTVADAVGRHAPAAPARVPAPAVESDLSTEEVPAVSVTPAPNGNGNGNGADKPAQRVDDLFARIRADRASGAADSPPSPPPPPPTVAAVLDPVTTEHALTGRDELLENVEAGLIRALKRVLQDEQNELLDHLRRMGSAAGPVATILADADVQRAAYRVAALPWLEQAARAGVSFVSSGEDAHPALDGQAEDLAAALVGPLRDRLALVLDDADDPTAAAESVRAAYRQWKVQHVEATARHHVTTAFSVGAYAATPAHAALQWLVENDGHCPDCDDNALAGPTPKGQPFPTGQVHPPAHHGCRCLLVPAPAAAGSPPA